MGVISNESTWEPGERKPVRAVLYFGRRPVFSLLACSDLSIQQKSTSSVTILVTMHNSLGAEHSDSEINERDTFQKAWSFKKWLSAVTL